jgi:hypothetical protein
MAPRTPLLRPDSYFAERDRSLGRVLAAFGLVVCTGVAAVYGVGYVLVVHVDGTVTVDNPERPPEPFCDDDTSLDVVDRSGCDAPREVERNVDPLVWRAVEELAGQMLVGLLLVAGALTALLHGGSWLAGGTNGVTASVAVAVWGLVPLVVVAPASLLALWVVLDPVTVQAAGDPSPAFTALEEQLRAHQSIGTVSSVVGSVWSAAIWRFGLEHERDVDGAAAVGIAGVTALVLLAGGAL